jgi:hypothetical protein
MSKKERQAKLIQEITDRVATEVVRTIVANACRWSQNILVEILGNYGEKMPSEARESLQKTIEHLIETQRKLVNL